MTITAPKAELVAARKWAATNGHKVGTRGQLPRVVLAAYRTEKQGDAFELAMPSQVVLEEDRLIKIEQLAEWLGFAVNTTYREFRKLGIPYIQVGGALRFRVGAVRAWLIDQEHQG